MYQKHHLAFFANLSRTTYTALCKHFKNPVEAFTADKAAFHGIGWKVHTIQTFIEWRKTFDPERADEQLETLKTRIVEIMDDEYPKLLASIYDPPPFLFVQGTLQSGPALAVVGPRKCSVYGRTVCRELVRRIASAGVIIVSGLAHGIDRVAHDTAIEVGGITVAVLGTGIDFTPHHLVESIVQAGGAIITEYPPGMPGSFYTFPKRNRIIAGLCHATLIVEAGASSGARITAQCALDTNRDLCVVPQNIDSETGVGSNELLKTGAHLITSADDIFHILDMDNVCANQTPAPTIQTPLNEMETAIVKELSREAVHVDVITRQTGLSNAVVCSTLTMLEIKGIVKNQGGMMYKAQ